MDHGRTFATASVTAAGSQQVAGRRKARPGRLRLVVLAVAVAGGFATAAGAGTDRAGAHAAGRPVLPAGQEAAIGRLLAVDPDAAGGYAFAGAAVAQDRVVARYASEEGGEVTVRLVHPAAAPRDAPGTRWVVFVPGEEGEALPEPLLAALVARAASHGEALVWTVPEPSPRPPRDWPVGRPGSWLAVGLLLAAGLVTLRRIRFSSARLEPAPTPAPTWHAADTAALVLILAGALGLRLVHLESRAIEPDEETALGPIPSLLRWAEEASDARFKPPLYGQLARLATGQTSDIRAARAVSVAAGVATVALVFVLVRRRAGLENAVLAALLVSVAASAVFVSGLARSYALLALTLLAAHAALHRALSRGGGWWEVYTAAAALALLTDYLALAPLLAEAAVVFLAARPRPVRLAAGLAAAAALALVVFLVPVVWPTVVGGLAPEPTARVGPGGALTMSALALSGGLPIFGLAALLGLCAAAAWKGGLAERGLVAAAAAVVAANVLGSHFEAVRPRYVLHALPLLAVAFGAGAAALPAGVRRTLLVVLTASHAFLLADLYGRRCGRMEVCTEPPIDGIVEAVRQDLAAGAAEAVILAPRRRMTDLAYRLHGIHVGRDAVQKGRPFPAAGDAPCPTPLCFAAPSAPFYGSDAAGTGVAEALARHQASLLLVREDADLPVPAGCEPIAEEGGYALFRCGAP